MPPSSHPAFEPVVLRHPRLPLSAHVIPFGLNVTRLVFDDPTTGAQHDVIVGPEDPSDHLSKGRTFLGPIIGRYANRLPAGKHAFDGGSVTVAASSPGVALHGGPEVAPAASLLRDDVSPDIRQGGQLVLQQGPFDRLIWQRLSSARSSQLFGVESPSTASGSTAIFGLLSKGDEEHGYPGTLRVEVRLAIQPGSITETASGGGATGDGMPQLGRSAGALRVEYRAAIVDDCAATPLNVTQHWSFNLTASDAGARALDGGRVDQHTLRMFAPPRIPTPGPEPTSTSPSKLYAVGLEQDTMLPTGELIDCSGTAHDWLAASDADGNGHPIIRPDGLAEGYDHFYTWGAPNTAAAQQFMHPYHVARAAFATPRLVLSAPANTTNLSLAFRTNQSGVQVYTATGQPDAPAQADDAGGAQKRLHADEEHQAYGCARRSGVALEFAHPHATFLHKRYQDFAQNDTILRRGMRYDNWVEVELLKKL